MKTKLKVAHPDAVTIDDLCDVTSLSKPSVTAAILRGELPGYKVGFRYVIPTPAFEAFVNGTWKPEPRPQVITPAKPMLVRKAS